MAHFFVQVPSLVGCQVCWLRILPVVMQYFAVPSVGDMMARIAPARGFMDSGPVPDWLRDAHPEVAAALAGTTDAMRAFDACVSRLGAAMEQSNNGWRVRSVADPCVELRVLGDAVHTHLHNLASAAIAVPGGAQAIALARPRA
jgi:hypothetical protein